MLSRSIVINVFIFSLLTLAGKNAFPADKEKELDTRIRQVVETMFKEKDAEITSLKERVQELEQRLKNGQGAQNPSVSAREKGGMVDQKETDGAEQQAERAATQIAEERDEKSGLSQQLESLKAKVKDLSGGHEDGLKVSGFFDVTARTENRQDRTFNLGAVELDLEYDYSEQFAGSAALVWDGDQAQVGVAVIDYHQFDHHTPPRGRIFLDPGFHLQVGRFDLPFGLDYQYFAAPDRATITAPLTTERIQGGGFNSDGVRLYGSWNVGDYRTILNYSAYWVDSVFDDKGTSVGGRIGATLENNPFQIHRHSSPNLAEIGASVLVDFDEENNTRNNVYGLDFSFNYEILQLWSEVVWRDAHAHVFAPDGTDLGTQEEAAYHVTATLDLSEWLGRPIYFFGRYGHWSPDYDFVVLDDATYQVESLRNVSVGFSYNINEYLRVKLEYFDSLGDKTSEPEFEDRLGIAQVVVAF